MSATPTSPTWFSSLGRQLRANLQTYALLLALVAIWGLFSAVSPVYWGAQNFSNLFRQMVITAIMSVGMVLVIVTGGIDLSVGKLSGFVSVMAAYFLYSNWPRFLHGQDFVDRLGHMLSLPETTVFQLQQFLPALLAVLVGLLVGIVYGVVQGYIIAYMRVPAFIVTLGSLWILNGAILIRTGGRTLFFDNAYFAVIGQGYVPPAASWIIAAGVVVLLFYMMFAGRRKKRRYGFEIGPLYLDTLKTLLFSAGVVLYVYKVNQSEGIQVPVLILAVFVVVVQYVSNNTRFGRYAYAIGGNREAARLSGVNIRQNIFQIFVLMGALCGVSGVVLASYVNSGTIGAGQGYELDAIASCILGGTSTLGGEGTVWGAIVGALIMASLSNGLQVIGVPSNWQYVLKGIVLVLAVFADVQLKKNR